MDIVDVARGVGVALGIFLADYVWGKHFDRKG